MCDLERLSSWNGFGVIFWKSQTFMIPILCSSTVLYDMDEEICNRIILHNHNAIETSRILQKGGVIQKKVMSNTVGD